MGTGTTRSGGGDRLFGAESRVIRSLTISIVSPAAICLRLNHDGGTISPLLDSLSLSCGFSRSSVEVAVADESGIEALAW